MKNNNQICFNNKLRYNFLAGIIFITLIFVILFAYQDALQIRTIYNIEQEDKWDIYNQYTAPAILFMWFITLGAFALIYYMFSKDISESLAVFAFPYTLLFFGLEDLVFFIFQKMSLPTCMAWFKGMPIVWISKYVLQEPCPSPLSMYISVFSGIIFAILLLFLLVGIDRNKKK